MKKMLAIAALVLSALPTFSLAAGTCGSPPAANPNFCTCFLDASSIVCGQHYGGTGSPICQTKNIAARIKGVSDGGFDGFCNKWRNLFPAGITHKECVDDMKYVKYHC